MSAIELNFDVHVDVSEKGKGAPTHSLKDLSAKTTMNELIAFMKTSLVTIATDVLKEEQAKGFDQTPVITVDGRSGRPMADVLPFGKIEINSRINVNEMLIETYEGILSRSPILTGEFKSHNLVFLNGYQVAADLQSFKSWLADKKDFQDTDKIRFINTQPYARKLERLGVTYGNERFSRRSSRFVKSRAKSGPNAGQKVLAPNGTYFLTARSIQRKYKRTQSVQFGFIPGSSIGLTDHTQQHHFKTKRRAGEKSRTYLYPNILITVSEEGSL